MPSAVIFDMDGLLIDSERVIMEVWLERAAAHGVAVDHASYLRCVGKAWPEARRILCEALGGDEPFRLIQPQVQRRLEDIAHGSGFPLKRGVVELLAQLEAARVPCGVASSSAVAEIEHRLTVAGVRRHFRALAGGDEVARGKPDPSVYLLAASRLGVDPRACLVFEDSSNGARAALAAGATLVLVPDLVPAPDDVVARCLHVFDSLADSVPHVANWF
jgi:HAD superfamily hydrolase (TIGR01509 family)